MNLWHRTLTFFLLLLLLLYRNLFNLRVLGLLYFDLLWSYFIFYFYFFERFDYFFDVLLIFFIDIDFNSLIEKSWFNGCNINLRFFMSFFEVYFQIIIGFKGNMILISIQIMKWICFYLCKWFAYESMNEFDWCLWSTIENSDLFF